MESEQLVSFDSSQPTLDAQTIVDTVVALDDETAFAIVKAIVQSRPELAVPLVTFVCPELTYPPSKAMTERRCKGLVKSLNVEKGYGFVECHELNEVFGSDVFMHIKQSNGVGPGAQVSFAVMLNKEMRPQAYDVQPEDAKGGWEGKGGVKGSCGAQGWSSASKGSVEQRAAYDSGAKGGHKAGDESWPAEGSDRLMAMMQGFNSGGWGGDGKGTKGDLKGVQVPVSNGPPSAKGDGKSPSMSSGKGCGKSDVQEVLGEFDGTIKSFNAKSGYGFIECEGLKAFGCPNDVFLHHRELGEYEVGARVSFTAYMNREGRPQAKDLKPPVGGGLVDDSNPVKKVKLSW